MGRLVPTKIIAGNHIDSWDVVRKLKENGADVRFIDNSLGEGKAKEVSFEELVKKIRYPSKKELTDILNAEAKRLLDNKQITYEQYRGYVE